MKEHGRGGHHGRGGKKKGFSQYYSYNLSRIITETRKLEMELLVLEGGKVFEELRKMVRQAKKPYPEDPDCEKTESE